MVVTLKPTEVMVPGPVPAARSSEARIKYWLRPSCQYVLYGVTLDPVVGVVPVPMVYTWAESWTIEASINEKMSSLRIT